MSDRETMFRDFVRRWDALSDAERDKADKEFVRAFSGRSVEDGIASLRLRYFGKAERLKFIWAIIDEDNNVVRLEVAGPDPQRPPVGLMKRGEKVIRCGDDVAVGWRFVDGHFSKVRDGTSKTSPALSPVYIRAGADE